jgi:DNA-binding response OmpR family regulator
VLLVEDEDTLRLSVSKILRKKGFSVIEASDGRSAVNVLRDLKESIDLILLDMTIPGTSSLGVVQEARRIRPEAKIILTSAYSREIAMASIDGAQVRGYIRKPFRLADLVQMLRDTLSSESKATA